MIILLPSLLQCHCFNKFVVTIVICLNITVEKYTGAEPSIGSRISLHSVRKKMTRVKQSITQRTGLRHKVR